MKKFIPLVLLLISSIFIFSCKDDDTIVEVDYPTVYDLNVNFVYNADDGWNFYQRFNRSLLDQDYVVIFRQAGTENGAAVWQQIPRTLYLTQGELDYDFDFTKNDFLIYAGGTYDISTTPQYLNNQRFRVVLVPAVFGGKNTNSQDISKMSYDEIIARYNIDDSKIGTF
ncbi:hypothetical protein [Chryseobacterium sp. FH1]|uniref:hypothetical protein n=1 Tax=Chryseobacterium sp. FH1 TaxID=1233951 RepID=UPI0004E2A02E|nr:hypothetical protein [Chryseobacterium sp. FH1]KFC18792.1 hypothetical protein IO90_17535 [Chryseobacterium sp. FH1]